MKRAFDQLQAGAQWARPANPALEFFRCNKSDIQRSYSHCPIAVWAPCSRFVLFDVRTRRYRNWGICIAAGCGCSRTSVSAAFHHQICPPAALLKARLPQIQPMCLRQAVHCLQRNGCCTTPFTSTSPSQSWIKKQHKVLCCSQPGDCAEMRPSCWAEASGIHRCRILPAENWRV